MDNVGVLGPTILLHSGNYFSYLKPEHSNYTIEDIAHGLANTCRFGGQCDKFYSVAQHSYYASFFATGRLRLPALLHDASEAFTGDMCKPLKNLLPEFSVIEKRIQADIRQRYCINLDVLAEANIKTIDLRLLKTEQRQLMHNEDSWTAMENIESFDLTIKPWKPKKAKRKFLERYQDLVNR